MIDVRQFQCNPLQENCYVISDETRQAVVVDCGAFFAEERKAITTYIAEQQLELCHVLCTHGHLDHIFGVDTLYSSFGLKPRLHQADVALYQNMKLQAKQFMGVTIDVDVPPAGDTLAEGDIITFGNHQIEVIHTPGHSPGSMVFYIKDEETAFSGDTLFRMSVGRTDLEGGSWQQLMDSLQRLSKLLPASTTVYTGHGPATTMGDELRYNPYLS